MGRARGGPTAAPQPRGMLRVCSLVMGTVGEPPRREHRKEAAPKPPAVCVRRKCHGIKGSFRQAGGVLCASARGGDRDRGWGAHPQSASAHGMGQGASLAAPWGHLGPVPCEHRSKKDGDGWGWMLSTGARWDIWGPVGRAVTVPPRLSHPQLCTLLSCTRLLPTLCPPPHC